MKLPRRRQFLQSGRGRCRAVGMSRVAQGRKPIRRGRCSAIVGYPAGGGHRHRRAPDGSTAVGAARPAIRHREPARRRHGNIAHRGGRARASGRLHASGCRRRLNAINATLVRQAQFQFHSATSRRSRASIRESPCHAGAIHRFQPRRFPSSLPTPRPIRARSTWRRPATELATHLAGELFKMMAGIDMVHVPYRGGGARTHRSARRAGASVLPRHALPSTIEYIRAGKLRALAVTTATRSEALPRHADRRAISCRATRRACGWHSAHPRTRPPKSSTR